jgi:hypothetical protein
LRAVRQWQLFLQLDENTRKASQTEDIKFLRSIVKNKLGTHVYKQDGNLKGEYIARCKDCDNCSHLVKVGPGENSLFKIMVFGEHLGLSTERPKHGIAKSLLERIDAAANLNTTTMLIRSSLEMDKSINRNLIPSTQQLNNRLSHLKRKSGSQKMEIIEDINAFINLKTVKANSEEYHKLDDNEYFVVSSNEFESIDDKGEACSCAGFTLTSKDMINNLENAIETSHEQGLVLCVDGSYKLIIGNWVIIIVGSTVIIFEVDGSQSDASDHLSFRPHFMQVTMVEKKPAYDSLFETMVTVAKDFLGVDLFVAKVIMDHCYPSYNAVTNVLRQIDGTPTDIVDCSVHIKRNVRIIYDFSILICLENSIFIL